MKNLLIASILVLGFQIAQAQNPTTTTAPAAKPAMKSEAKPAAKAGARTADTKQAPTTEAKPDMTSEKAAEGKEHVCTAACKEGKHSYAHGEKGHKCTAACHPKKAMKTSSASKGKTGADAPAKAK